MRRNLSHNCFHEAQKQEETMHMWEGRGQILMKPSTGGKDPLLDKAPAWTKEQYDLMQEHAHELGYHLITPFRKGLKNIKVGVIRYQCEMCTAEVDSATRFCNKCAELL